MHRLALLALLVAGPAWAGAFQGVSFGIGGASGYDFTWSVPRASPMLSVGVDVGSPRVAAWFAFDSALTFLTGFSPDTAGSPGFMATVGVTGGSERFRVGGYGTIGYFAYGAGATMRILPWQDKRGGRHGFDIRADWLGLLTLRGALMYTWRPPWGLERPE